MAMLRSVRHLSGDVSGWTMRRIKRVSVDGPHDP